MLLRGAAPNLPDGECGHPLEYGGAAPTDQAVGLGLAAGSRHGTCGDAGHLLQDDQGEKLAEVVLAFIAATP